MGAIKHWGFMKEQRKNLFFIRELCSYCLKSARKCMAMKNHLYPFNAHNEKYLMDKLYGEHENGICVEFLNSE